MFLQICTGTVGIVFTFFDDVRSALSRVPPRLRDVGRLGPAADSESCWKDLRELGPEVLDDSRGAGLRQDWASTSSWEERLRFRYLTLSGYLQTCDRHE